MGSKESNYEKGQRNEREATDILSHVYGAGVEKVDAYSNSDPFGFVDIIAMGPDGKILFVQVKTNNFTKKEKRKLNTR